VLVRILNIVRLLNIHLMIHDPSKYIIGCHLLIGGVSVDLGNHIIVHGSICHHQPLGQYTVGLLLGP
jgi:hypothetical protein